MGVRIVVKVRVGGELSFMMSLGSPSLVRDLVKGVGRGPSSECILFNTEDSVSPWNNGVPVASSLMIQPLLQMSTALL